MPKSKTVEKTARAAERRRLRNKSIKSATKTKVTKAETLIASGKPESAGPAVVVAISAIDKAAKKRVIHPNTAARRKSRLMKKLNQAKSSSTSKPKAADKTKK